MVCRHHDIVPTSEHVASLVSREAVTYLINNLLTIEMLPHELGRVPVSLLPNNHTLYICSSQSLRQEMLKMTMQHGAFSQDMRARQCQRATELHACGLSRSGILQRKSEMTCR